MALREEAEETGWARGVGREDRREIPEAQVAREDLAEDGAEVGRKRQVAPFAERPGLELKPGPLAVDLADPERFSHPSAVRVSPAAADSMRSCVPRTTRRAPADHGEHDRCEQSGQPGA